MPKRKSPAVEAKIIIYFDTTARYSYSVSAKTTEELTASVREHCEAMGRSGVYVGPRDGEMTYWPPHRIRKIKVRGALDSSVYQGTWDGV